MKKLTMLLAMLLVVSCGSFAKDKKNCDPTKGYGICNDTLPPTQPSPWLMLKPNPDGSWNARNSRAKIAFIEIGDAFKGFVKNGDPYYNLDDQVHAFGRMLRDVLIR
ncbi:MAG TPA: hypothetical protein VMT05_13555 [Terriglobales bacterium]|jgi:hypothetical protein|nr:hypothetical protein [Terriglobales bacterium]